MDSCQENGASSSFGDVTRKARVVYPWFLLSKVSLAGIGFVPWVLAVFDVAADSLRETCLKMLYAR